MNVYKNYAESGKPKKCLFVLSLHIQYIYMIRKKTKNKRNWSETSMNKFGTLYINLNLTNYLKKPSDCRNPWKFPRFSQLYGIESTFHVSTVCPAFTLLLNPLMSLVLFECYLCRGGSLLAWRSWRTFCQKKNMQWINHR